MIKIKLINIISSLIINVSYEIFVNYNIICSYLLEILTVCNTFQINDIPYKLHYCDNCFIISILIKYKFHKFSKLRCKSFIPNQ